MVNMKSFDELFDDVIKHEGYYANVQGDRGGETYMGVARNLHPDWEGWSLIDGYKAVHGGIRRNQKIPVPGLIEAVKVFYGKRFYDAYRIGDVLNGSLQGIIFDWCVNSGRYGSKGVQRVLNDSFGCSLVLDGLIGDNTIAAINACKPADLFAAIKAARVDFYRAIAEKGQNYKFLGGWLKRINSFVFEG